MAARPSAGRSQAPRAPQGSPHEARRDGRKARAAGGGRLRVVISAIIGVICLLALAAVVVVNSSLFAATDIQVKGSEHVTSRDARRLMSLPEGATLLNINESEVIGSLKENPWISGVTVERVFPHTLIVTPTERKVQALAYIQTDDIAWAIGDDGAWIAPVSLAATLDKDGNVIATPSKTASGTTSGGSGADGASGTDAAAQQEGAQTVSGLDAARALAKHFGAVLFVDVSSDVAPASGETAKSKVIVAGLEYVKGFSADFLKTVQDISLPSVDSISVDLTSGVEVSVGAATDISRKEQVVTKVLQQVEGVTYINVRTPDAYSYRAVPKE